MNTRGGDSADMIDVGRSRGGTDSRRSEHVGSVAIATAHARTLIQSIPVTAAVVSRRRVGSHRCHGLRRTLRDIPNITFDASTRNKRGVAVHNTRSHRALVLVSKQHIAKRLAGAETGTVN